MKEYTITITVRSSDNETVGRETEIISKSLETLVPGFFKDLGKDVNIKTAVSHK